MYEGKNIHYSPVDQRPLCSFSGKVCKQRRLNGYALCLRHILEDISAPYKRCINLARNGQQCSNVIPQSRNTDYCNSHANAQASQASGLAQGTIAQGNTTSSKPTQQANGSESGLTTVTFSSPHLNSTLASGSESRKKTSQRSVRKASTSSAGFDDPYAFPSDPEPDRKVKQLPEGNVTQPFPSLSQALANMAANAKGGQSQVHDGGRTDSTVSSMAKLYPELADKLDINKKSPKSEPVRGKIVLSSPSNNKSSRTMNRLQTKIAQNRIKDKLKKSGCSNIDINSSINCSTSSIKPSQIDSTVTKLTLSEAMDYTDLSNNPIGTPTDTTTNKICHISTSSLVVDSNSTTATHDKKPKSRSKSKSGCRGSNGSNSTVKTEVNRSASQFPTLESQLQTSPLINPWSAPFYNLPAPVPIQGDNQKPIFHPMAPPVPYVVPPGPTFMPEASFIPVSPAKPESMTATLPGLPVGKALEALKSTFPMLPAQVARQTMEAVGKTVSPPNNSATTTPSEVKSSDEKEQSSPVCSQKNVTESVIAVVKPSPQSVPHTEVQTLGTPTTSNTVKLRVYKGRYSMKEACQRVKRRSAMQICLTNEKRKRANFNLIPMGVDSSEDDTSDFEEVLPSQREWLLSSSESEEEEDILDDPLLANIRHTKQALLQVKLRRSFLQANKSFYGNSCLHGSQRRDISSLLAAVRSSPLAAAEALKLNLRVAKSSGEAGSGKSLHGKRPCLCKSDTDKACNRQALPFTNQCNKHIMYNVEQQLYDYCTAKFSDNTQCCVPVFDIRHELPLCPEHAAKAENYQKNLEASRPKKPRKKTKPSALTRPPKKGKKKKNQRKLNKTEKPSTPSVTDATSGDEHVHLDVEGPCGTNQSEPSVCATPPPCPSSPEIKREVDPVTDALSNELEESFSPGTIDKHLELPLGEQDLNEVLNKLPVDAFELFTGKNGDFANTRMEEEAAAFEHVLAETSKKLKATEASDNRLSMLMDSHSNIIRNDAHLLEDGRNEDEITKEIADSILQQELSPSASIVDDLAQDNISALASSLSAHDLGNISQVLNASLINPSSGGDLSSPIYGASPVQQQATIVGAPTNMMTSAGHQSHVHVPAHGVISSPAQGIVTYPFGQPSVGANFIGAPPLNSNQVNHTQSVCAGLAHIPTRQVQESTISQSSQQNGTSSSSQSIAQILASLTAGTKQFTNNAVTPSNPPASPYAPVVPLETFIQGPPESSADVRVPQSLASHNASSTSLDNRFQAPPISSLIQSSIPTGSHPTAYASPQVHTGSMNASSRGAKLPQGGAILQNGLIPTPVNMTQTQQGFAMPIASAASQLGLKLSCPLQTLVPVELLNSSLAQTIPGGHSNGGVLTNHTQPLVTMANSSNVLPIATVQAQGTTPGKA